MVMRIRTACALAFAFALGSAGPARAEVRLAINDGRVTLTATNATVREILSEWAKVGKTTIVNAERIAGGPITIQLSNVYEEQALDVIMRSVSAYLAAPRLQLVANSSRFASILVLPTSTPPRNTPAPTTPTYVPPPQFNPPPPPISDDDDNPRTAPPGTQRGPIFNTFPQPQYPQQGMPVAPVPPPPGRVGGPGPSTPQSIGVPVPGMIVQPPQQPGQPGQIPQDR